MTSIIVDRLDGLSSSVAIKGPCRVATTANITLSGTQTIDGVLVAVGDRVLVKNQTTASENGIYYVDTGSWRRTKDFARSSDVVTGSQVFVTNGTVAGGASFIVATSGSITIGTTSIAFTQIPTLSSLIELGIRPSPTATATPEEFGGTDASAFQAAIDYLEAAGGGTLLLGNDRYQHPFTGEYFSNPTIMDTPSITIRGVKRPTFNSTFSALEGGTILEGSFFFAADNFAMYDLGIDSGSDYCTANNGGVPVEGINGVDRKNAGVSGYAGGDPTKYNVILDNIAILCHKTGKVGDDSDVHALLLENYKGWRVSNVVSVKGGAGLVIKSSYGAMSNVWVRGSYKYGVLNKSEAYSDASFNTFDQILAENLSNDDPDITVTSDYDQGVAFRIEAANADARHVTATNIIGNGVSGGIQFYALNGHVVDNCHVIGAQFRKVDGYTTLMNRYGGSGTIQNCTVESVKVNEGSYGFYFFDGTDNCAFINCQARDVTYYSFGNTFGTNNRLVTCSSDTPFSGHIVTTGGDMTVFGGFHRIGSATLHQNLGGTLSGLTDEGLLISKGPELFTNGDGESTTGWLFSNATGAIVAGGVTGNCFESTRTGAPAGYSYQNFNVVVGQRYKVSISQKNGTGSTRFYLGSTLGNGIYTGGSFVTMSNAAWTNYEYNFVASSTSLFVTFQHASVAPGTFLIDNVSVKAVPITADGDIYAGGSLAIAGNSAITGDETVGGTLGVTGAITSASRAVPTYLTGTATYDPASLADGVGATTTVTVTGAALGDIATASFSLDLQGITLTAWVSAANTVSVRFQNESGGVLDLASGTIKAWVLK